MNRQTEVDSERRLTDKRRAMASAKMKQRGLRGLARQLRAAGLLEQADVVLRQAAAIQVVPQ